MTTPPTFKEWVGALCVPIVGIGMIALSKSIINASDSGGWVEAGERLIAQANVMLEVPFGLWSVQFIQNLIWKLIAGNGLISARELSQVVGFCGIMFCLGSICCVATIWNGIKGAWDSVRGNRRSAPVPNSDAG